MFKRGVLVVVVAVLIFAAASCSEDDKPESGATSTAANTTAATGTTVNTTGTTDTAETPASSSSSTTSQISIPPVTPPPGQPATCSLLSESALAAVGVPAGTAGVAADQLSGSPAPSTGCRWDSVWAVTLSLYYGRDPLEILALVRQQSPGGTEITGIGQDAYYVPGVLFVDTGSQAFAISGLAQEQLQTLAQNVLTNL